jgi:hypothetical protein
VKIDLSPPITDDEKKGIIEAYCREYADLLSLKAEGNTVNKIMMSARSIYEDALKQCEEDPPRLCETRFKRTQQK